MLILPWIVYCWLAFDRSIALEPADWAGLVER